MKLEFVFDLILSPTYGQHWFWPRQTFNKTWPLTWCLVSDQSHCSYTMHCFKKLSVFPQLITECCVDNDNVIYYGISWDLFVINFGCFSLLSYTSMINHKQPITKAFFFVINHKTFLHSSITITERFVIDQKEK